MKGIPSELYEAARLDGASPTRCFFKITLPLLAVLDKVPAERRTELLGRLACCHDDEESVEYLQRTVENEGGLTFAAEVMRSYIARAVEMLSEYEASDYRTALANLCAYIAERDR